ncbi:MAG: pirin family protein, partial [Nocardioidaceae bacterium]
IPGVPVIVATGEAARWTDDVLRLAQPSATLHAVRLRPGERVLLPSAPLIHVFVVSGSVELNTGLGSDMLLQEGDAAHLTALSASAVKGQADTDVLLWEMHSV